MTGETAPQTSQPAGGLLAQWRDTPLSHAAILALFSLCTALVLSLVDDITRGPIAQRAAEDLTASLAQVIPGEIHDNDLTAGPMTISDATEGDVLVYRARLGDRVNAVAFEMTGVGYAGPIVVLLGVDETGRLLGTRVLAHTETPGLGDKIEVAKSDWILGFTGRSLRNPGPSGWKVQREGGAFDQFSGATITPRTVVATVHRGLEFFDRHRDALLAVPPTEKESR
ncbi:MAG: electron transport complex subunit RsxG [Pseudomonadota bacterium]